jgi:uncharacterized membrane protein YfcA
MAIDLTMWQWASLLLAGFLIGISKTGIAGLGGFAVAMFSLSLPTREAVGAVLPVLIVADIVAVLVYRRHADWSHLLRLFPWTAVGVVVGYVALGRINDRQVTMLVGAILLALVLLQQWRRRHSTTSASDSEKLPDNRFFSVGVGVLVGFTTMVANAAGPIMALYLLAMRLPKMVFVGTTAWYFMLLNLFKVPFSLGLGMITPASLALDLRLAPVAILGALSGRVLIRHIDQALFEKLVLGLTFLAALRLLF